MDSKHRNARTHARRSVEEAGRGRRQLQLLLHGRPHERAFAKGFGTSGRGTQQPRNERASDACSSFTLRSSTHLLVD